MANLIDASGGYVYRSFTGSNGTWTIVGTRTQVNHSNPLLCMDTFKSDKGNQVEMKREEVMHLANQGKIKPVLDSLIIGSSGSTKRRAI